MSDTKTPLEYADEILKDKKPYALKIAKELRKAEGNRVLLDQSAQCLEDDCDYLKTIAESITASHKSELQEKYVADGLVVMHDAEMGTLARLGDIAKLREALETVRDAHFVREENGEDCEGFDVEADDGTGRPLICVVEDALAAPARNCDSYDSADEMMEEYADDAFLVEWKEWRKTGKCHPLMSDAFNCINWLFLTNKKGDSDGSK